MRLLILTILFLLTTGIKCFGQDYTIEMGEPSTSESINSYVFVDDENIIYCGGLVSSNNYSSVLVASRPKFKLLYGKFNIKTKSHVWAYSIDWAKGEEGTNFGGGTYEKVIKLNNGELLMFSRSNHLTWNSLVTKIDNMGNVIYHRQLLNCRIHDFDEGNNNAILALSAGANFSDIHKFNHLNPMSTINSIACAIPQGFKSPKFRKILCEKSGGENNAFYIAGDVNDIDYPQTHQCVEHISFLKFSDQNNLSSFVFQKVLDLNSPSVCVIPHFCNSFTLEGDFAQISYNYGDKTGIARFDKNSGTILTNNLFDKVISGSGSHDIPEVNTFFVRGFHNGQKGNLFVRTRQFKNSEKKFLILESDNSSLGSKYSTVNYIMKDLSMNDCQIWNNSLGFHALSAGGDAFGNQIIISNKKIASPMDCNMGIANIFVLQQFSQFNLGVYLYPGYANIESEVVSLPRVSHNFAVKDLECVPCLTFPSIQSQDITYPNPE